MTMAAGARPGIGDEGRTVAAPGLRVLVCGERERGDDAVGPIAVEAVLAALPAETRGRLDVRWCGGPDPIDLLDQPVGQPCLIVDAVVGVSAGEVISLPLDAPALDQRGCIPATTHTMPLPETLALAAVVRGHPVTGRLVGLGGARFGLGERPGEVVAAALPRFEAAIREAILALLDG